MRKWMEKISRWKFDKKMQLLVTVSIIATTLIVLAVSTISSVTSMKQQSIELLQAQNSTTAENFKSSLDNYKTLAIATVMDTSIQQYLKTANFSKETGGLKNNAYNILASISNMHSDMNFIAVVGKSPDDYIYKGQIAISAAQFSQVYTFDSQQCKTVQDSSIKMCFNNAYFNGTKYTLNIYFPIYDTNRVLGELGLLCMNFTDPSLQQILEYDSSKRLESMVVDTDGMMISARDKEKIGTNVDFIPKMKGVSGTFSKDGRLYIYQKVSNWRFYVVSSVPMMELYKSSIRTIFLMAFILLFLLTLSLMVVKRIISKVYRPLDKVVRKMDDVASGSLKTRINVEHMGEDFTKLAVGFNSMMEEILVLMDQVKMELEHVRNYLIIQNMRYDDIIGSEFDVEEAASDVMIPKLTLQPLVENSIYHGIKVKEGKTGSLFLKVRKRSSDVLITLADTGTGMSQQQIDEMNQHLSEYDDSFGYGVRNVNKRIELLYGEEFGLYYLRNESGGVTVEIRLPYVTQVEDGIIRGEMIHV